MPPTESARSYRVPLTAIALIAVLASLAFAFALSGGDLVR